MTMRFGMFVPQGWRMDLAGIDPAEHWTTMKNLALRADAGLWESIWVYDHFHTVPKPSEEATHEAWTLMSAFAAVTDRVRLGQMCTCMAYRNPAYLAKVAATIDTISGGRVEMGIGAGWYEQEWRAYGYGFPAAGNGCGCWTRVCRSCGRPGRRGPPPWPAGTTRSTAPSSGRLPQQPDGPPLWIAGGGEKVTLRIAAKYAQYTNFDGTLDGFTAKSALLEQHCADVGTDFGSIVRSSNYNVAIGRTQAEVDDQLAWLSDRMTRLVGAERAESQVRAVRGMPACGTPDQIIENLTKLNNAGMSYGIFYFADAAYRTSSIELFEQEVIPALIG